MTSTIGSNVSESLKKAAMAGLMALILLGVTASSAAQQLPLLTPRPPAAPTAPKAAKPAVAADDEEEAPKPKKDGGEGIHVIGHWILDLKDKDGKLVEHRDFHNALIDPSALVGLLTGYFSGSNLEIDLNTLAGTAYVLYPAGNNPSAAVCAYFVTYSTYTGNGNYNCIPGLIQTAIPDTTNGSFFTGIKLQGQIAPANGDSIAYVGTSSAICGQIGTTYTPGTQTLAYATATTSPTACSTNAGSLVVGGESAGPYAYRVPLTQKDLTAAPLTILPGQTLSVTVTLSFN